MIKRGDKMIEYLRIIAAGKRNERQTMVVDPKNSKKYQTFGIVTANKYVKASKTRVSDTNLGVSNAKGGLFLFENNSSSMLVLNEKFMIGNTSARWSA